MGHATQVTSDTALNIRVVRTSHDFMDLEPQWDSLLRRLPAHTPFSTHAWLQSWIEVFGDQVQILTFVVANEDLTVGIAPLGKWKSGIITFLGYPQNDYSDFLIDPSFPAAVGSIFQALLALPERWTRIVLDQIPESSHSLASISSWLSKNRKSFLVEKADACPAMTLEDLTAAKKVYYKTNISNYINRFKKQGNFSFNIYDETETAVTRMEDMFHQHISRWSKTATPSAFANERIREFYRRFVARMHPLGWIHFCSLSVDEKYIAFFLSIEYANKLHLYKFCFNTDYVKLSPGQTILRYIFDYASGKALDEIDFCRGDEAYKFRFSNVIRHNSRIAIYRHRLSWFAAKTLHFLMHSRVMAAFSKTRIAGMTKKFILYLRPS